MGVEGGMRDRSYVWVILLIDRAPGGWYHEVFGAVRVRDDAIDGVSHNPRGSRGFFVYTSSQLVRQESFLAPNLPLDDCSAQ